MVALHEGCVDRNKQSHTLVTSPPVALHEGCVDRNRIWGQQEQMEKVALHEGCVDRNAAMDEDTLTFIRRTPRGVRG